MVLSNTPEDKRQLFYSRNPNGKRKDPVKHVMGLIKKLSIFPSVHEKKKTHTVFKLDFVMINFTLRTAIHSNLYGIKEDERKGNLR